MLVQPQTVLFICTGANLNVKDEDGMTPLHHAASNGHFYAAQLLLNLGANEKIATRYFVPICVR